MNTVLFLAQATSDASGTSAATGYSSIILMVALVAIMYFLMIRPQRKRQKEEQEMRSSIEIGDEIVTIGGIIGKVVKVRDEDIVIETGADRTKMKLKRWAINTNVTQEEEHRKEVAAARAAAQEKKGRKSKKNDDDKSDTAKAAEKKIEE